MNSEDKRKVKVGICISAFTVVLFIALSNFPKTMDIIKFTFGVFSPFILGICIAFVLNILLNFFENTVFKRLKDNDKFQKIKRPLCIVLTIIVFLGIISTLLTFIIPELIRSVKTLVENMPGYIESLQSFTNDILSKFGVSANFYAIIDSWTEEFSAEFMNFVKAYLPKVIDTTKSVTSGIANSFIGFIVCIYLLATKESLIKNVKDSVYAFTPKGFADWITHVYGLAMKRFTGFVAGQLTEAVIIGVLCFACMKIFGMEYALLISVIIAITNIIPIIGPIIGTVPGALLLLMINPIKALWFVVLIIVLQQIESNFIYPRVVGESVGLPGLWVMLAVIVGGKLFGLVGVILGVPTCAVLYAILSEQTKKKLKQKGLYNPQQKTKSGNKLPTKHKKIKQENVKK